MEPTYQDLQAKVADLTQCCDILTDLNETKDAKIQSLLKCCDAMAIINTSYAEELDKLRPRALSVRGYTLGD